MSQVISRRAAAALPLAALLGPAAAAMPALASAGDAVLVDLGRRWEAALAAERAHNGTFGIDKAMGPADISAFDAISDQLYEARWALFDQAVGMPATSPAAIAVKAKMLAQIHDFYDVDEASLRASLATPQSLTDRVVLSLAVDLLRLARAAS